MRQFVFLTIWGIIGISRSSRHKRSATGAQRAHYRKKRKFELGRQPANTKLGAKRIHTVRVRGGNVKHRALRLDSGNFAWASEHATRKTRIIVVVSPITCFVYCRVSAWFHCEAMLQPSFSPCHLSGSTCPDAVWTGL